MDTDDDVSTLGEEEASLSEPVISTPDTVLDCLSESDQQDDINAENPQQALFLSPALSHQNSVLLEEPEVKFQVMCAHTKVSNSEKYVVYSIIMERGEDSRPALLERRYSDFLTLCNALKQSHPALLSNIKFPRKVLLGNFKVGVIEERSNCFEQFLSYVFSKDVLKCSEPFKAFLYRRELQESNQFLLHSLFEDAIPILENLYWLLCKLHGDRDLLLRVLLQLIVSLHAVGSYELSYDYALLALPRFDSRVIEGNCLAKELYMPFLIFCNRLWWMLGRDRNAFESRLEQMRNEGQRIEGITDLLDILRDEISLPSLYSIS